MSAIFLIWFHFANAQENLPAYCASAPSAKLEKRIAVPSDINFFLRASPQKNVVMFATSEGNKMLDLNTEKLTPLPGSIDPVTTPDGNVISVPMQKRYNPITRAFADATQADLDRSTHGSYWVYGTAVYHQGHSDNENSKDQNNLSQVSTFGLEKKGVEYFTSRMSFFRPGANDTVDPIYEDGDVYENYQSFGTLRQSAESAQYRLLFEGSTGLEYRDYNYNKVTKKLEPATAVTQVCGNQEMSGDLPMLGKDGTEFATYLPESEETVVYGINRMNGTCSVKDRIPALVGKVDFSPNGRQLAFHIDEGAAPDTDEFSVPKDSNQFGIFVFNRDKKNLIAVPTMVGEDSYYPVFLNDETLAFISATRGEGRKFFINVAKIHSMSDVDCADCQEGTRKGQLGALIGRIFNAKCGTTNFKFAKSLTTFLRMSKSQCRALVESLTDSDIKEMTETANLPGKSWKSTLISSPNKTELLNICGNGVTQSGGSEPSQTTK